MSNTIVQHPTHPLIAEESNIRGAIEFLKTHGLTDLTQEYETKLENAKWRPGERTPKWTWGKFSEISPKVNPDQLPWLPECPYPDWEYELSPIQRATLRRVYDCTPGKSVRINWIQVADYEGEKYLKSFRMTSTEHLSSSRTHMLSTVTLDTHKWALDCKATEDILAEADAAEKKQGGTRSRTPVSPWRKYAEAAEKRGELKDLAARLAKKLGIRVIVTIDDVTRAIELNEKRKEENLYNLD